MADVKYDNRVLRQLISNTPEHLDAWLRGVVQEIKGDIQVELRSLNQFRWESGGKSSGTNLLAYIIVQVVMSIAGIGTIIGVRYAIFKSH